MAYGQQLERSSLKLGVANNNVVDFECASVDVAQHQVGRASRVDRGDAPRRPTQADRSDKRRAGQLVVGDVVDFETAGLAVAQQQIGFAGIAAKMALVV